MSKKYSKINELLLTFFYCGKAKKAPGTVGTIGALIFWLFQMIILLTIIIPQFFNIHFGLF